MSTPPSPQCLGMTPSFGFGDRIGLATPGHIAAMQAEGAGIAPIFAQQSIREMTRTNRSPEQVMEDAVEGMGRAQWSDPVGADADHLKTAADIESTAAAGFSFFTIDPSTYVDGQADNYAEQELREKFAAIQDRVTWADTYRGREVTLPNGTTFTVTEEDTLRAAVKYGLAIAHAQELGDVIAGVQEPAGRPYEIELSVDETDQPTSLAEHLIIAEQCLEYGMKLISLAPRFIGDMEKGVDYIGDLAALEKSLNDHAAISRMLGGYKLSLHSGSDKISMYTAFARATRGAFHVKTAGTSYLEALRVAALCEPELFTDICNFARERYDIDKATYHVHATVNMVPAPATLQDNQAREDFYLERWATVPEGKGFTNPGRQILHCTFGSVLTHPALGAHLRACLAQNPEVYRNVLEEHFGRHLRALKAGM